MVVPIILYGSPAIRKHCIEVNETDNYSEIANILLETLKNAEGIGLAAPQINQLKRIFVINTYPLIRNDVTIEKFEGVFINPEIIDRDGEIMVYTEGCLSLPDIFEDVKRPEKIFVRYLDLMFNIHEEEMDGIKARIFQHEYDHLEGILFIDKINILKRKLITGKLKKIRKSSGAGY